MISIAFSSASQEIKQLCIHEPEGETRAVIQIVHGMAEHYARYYPLAEALRAKGYAVAGYDQIGHGPDTPKDKLGYLGDHNGWQRLVYDVNTVHTILRQRWPKAKQVLIGHSMGSFVVREYMIQFGQEAPDAVVLSGTGWQPPAVCRFGKALAGLVCHISGAQKPSRLLDRIVFSSNNRGFQPAETPYDWLSRDKEVVKRYAEDPYCGFPFTAGGFRDFFGGLLYLTDPKRLAGIPTEVPVLLISGDKDPVGDQGKGVAIVAEQLKAAGVKRVTTRLYPDARHELFNEINREEVIGDLVSWLEGLGWKGGSL